jgi:hypothetical protein
MSFGDFTLYVFLWTGIVFFIARAGEIWGWWG